MSSFNCVTYFIYEICRFKRPIRRDVSLFDLDLMRNDVISDFFAAAPIVGSSPKHAFVSNDSNSVVVNREGVILATHDLRSHVARCTRRILCVILPPDTCNTKVCDAQVTITLYDEVLWLDISVYNILVVDVLETSHETCDKESSSLLVEFTISANVVAQITS